MAKNPFSLEGKTAIVTGGGTGIGKSIAIEFAKAGADVAICSRKLEHLEPVVKAIRDLGRRSFAMAVDVRQEDQVKAMVERTAQELGRLDVMRSEERRVGKECRSVWVAEREKEEGVEGGSAQRSGR